mgnify:CR=1 FL=1
MAFNFNFTIRSQYEIYIDEKIYFLLIEYLY